MASGLQAGRIADLEGGSVGDHRGQEHHEVVQESVVLDQVLPHRVLANRPRGKGVRKGVVHDGMPVVCKAFLRNKRCESGTRSRACGSLVLNRGGRNALFRRRCSVRRGGCCMMEDEVADARGGGERCQP